MPGCGLSRHRSAHKAIITGVHEAAWCHPHCCMRFRVLPAQIAERPNIFPVNGAEHKYGGYPIISGGLGVVTLRVSRRTCGHQAMPWHKLSFCSGNLVGVHVLQTAGQYAPCGMVHDNCDLLNKQKGISVMHVYMPGVLRLRIEWEITGSTHGRLAKITAMGIRCA